MKRCGNALLLICGCVCQFANSELRAQPYPAKPVRVVIPATPGSNTDIFFRIIAPKMGAMLGQQFVADYRAGAGGVIGAANTIRSAPDGYTIAMIAAGFVMNPAIYKKLPYDPVRDITPLGLVADVPAGLVVHPSMPARDVRQLIALARARPGEINYASAGIGTVSHLAGELFNLLAHVQTVHIPYKSTAPAVIDLLAGHIFVSFPSIPSIIEHARAGRLRMLAQTGSARSGTLPDVPTMQEAGVPGYSVNSGFGLIGPAGLPHAMVEQINTALVKAIQDPATRKTLADNGADPLGSTPEEHDAFIKSEVAKWMKVAREAKIKQE